jgi:hypothetical protein
MIAIMLRDKLEKLISNKVEEPSHWIFQSQIRYYIELAEHVNNDTNRTFLDLKSQMRGNHQKEKLAENIFSYKKINTEMSMGEQLGKE